MINKLLYVNGTLVDLLPKTLIALTFQAGDIGDLKSRVADYSATINLPKTFNNRKTFGNIELINSQSNFPYRKASIDYTESGLNIIEGGTGIVTESSKYYKLNIYNGLVDFFGAIDGKNVDDIDFGVYETIDDAYIDSIKLSLGLFSAPVIDQGTLFPARQTLKNTKFVGDDSWTNEGPGVEWESGIFGNDQLGISVQDSSDPNTAYLMQDYKFFAGFRYRLTLTFEIVLSDPSATLDKLDLYIGSDPTRQLIGQVTSVSASTGTFTIDEYFTATLDQRAIQIYAEYTVANPGDQLRIVLRSIKVTDIEGIIDIKAPHYIPLMNYRQIIEKIITEAGYTPDFRMTDEDFFNNLYITFSKSSYTYPQRLIDKMNFRAIATGFQSLTISDALHHNIEFGTIIDSGVYAWYNGLDTFNVPALSYNVEYVVKARIIVDVSFGLATTSADFYFTIDGVTQTLLESVPFAPTDRYVFTFDSDVMTADATPKEFKLTVVCNGAFIQVDVIEGEFWVEIEKKAFGIVNLSALILPTKLQKDFLKDFFIRFGILAKEKKGVLTMSEMQKTIGTPHNHVDWTDKRDASTEEVIKFESRNYAQENIFKDITAEDELVTGESDSLDIDDETLPVTKDFYTSIMAAVQQNNNNGMRLCRIAFFDLTDNSPDYIASPALLYLRGESSGDSEIKYNGVTVTDYLICVYNDPTFEFNTTWEYFLEHYYPLIEAALQRAKTVTRLYNLNQMDIARLDLFKLLYDNNQYYLINKIAKYVSGSPTSVEIFKVLS